MSAYSTTYYSKARQSLERISERAHLGPVTPGSFEHAIIQDAMSEVTDLLNRERHGRLMTVHQIATNYDRSTSDALDRIAVLSDDKPIDEIRKVLGHIDRAVQDETLPSGTRVETVQDYVKIATQMAEAYFDGLVYDPVRLR